MRIMFFLIILFGCILLQAEIAITNQISGGLFGDNVIHYLKCKWLAYKYNLSFYFNAFPNANLLRVSEEENPYKVLNHKSKRIIQVHHESDISKNLNENTLFIINPYAPGFDFGTEDFIDYLLSNAPTDFIKNHRALLKPKKECLQIALPRRAVTVAVHIRKPNMKDFPLYGKQTFDISHYIFNREYIYLDEEDDSSKEPLRGIKGSEIKMQLYSDVNEGPAKFPPNQFYIDQIKAISDFFDDIPIYLHIFTCDPNPLELCDTIKKAVNKSNITYAHEEIDWHSDLLMDCNAMAEFDCLIKSTSTFSSVSQFMGRHAVTIVPKDFFWDDNKLIVHKTIWFTRNKEIELLRSRVKGA